jgi:3-oxoacyl-[acyl-carrier protein] reductase
MTSAVTVITGTRSGIGRFLAEHYVHAGHTVVGCSRNPVDWKLDGYEHYVADVTDEPAIVRMFSAIAKRHGRLDHLLNNAGVASMNHVLLTPMTTVERIFRTNVAGTFLCSREAAKLMKRGGSGRIVNFSSISVALKLEGEAIYTASKAAVESLTQVLARELAGYGVTVNAVGPGPIDTDLTRPVPKDKIARVVGRQAIPRPGTFEDVAHVCDFFLEERSRFVTGQVIYLGGV